MRPGCSLGSVKAGGTLELVGKVAVKRVEPLTKVIIRAENNFRLVQNSFFIFSSNLPGKPFFFQKFEDVIPQAVYFGLVRLLGRVFPLLRFPLSFRP